MTKIAKKIDVEIELDKEVLFTLFMEAHKQNVTFNTLITKYLEKYIKELEAQEKKNGNNIRRRPVRKSNV